MHVYIQNNHLNCYILFVPPEIVGGGGAAEGGQGGPGDSGGRGCRRHPARPGVYGARVPLPTGTTQSRCYRILAYTNVLFRVNKQQQQQLRFVILCIL